MVFRIIFRIGLRGEQVDNMSKLENYSGFLTWCMAALLVSFAAGCGNVTSDFSSIAVTPATATVPVAGTQQFTATGTVSGGTTTTDITNTVTWTSSATAVATVASSGLATGVSGGTATITATSGNKSGTATLTVTPALGPAPVVLGTAANFVILTKIGITDVPSSVITGNIGVSSTSGTAIVVTCAEVTGTIFSADAAGPLPCRVPNAATLTTAVTDMQAAYTDAAGRAAGVGPNLNLGAGTLTNQTLVPGTYTWASNVTIPTNLTFSGGANDVWILQIPGTLNLDPNMQVLLTGGAKAKNIFWQVAGTVTLGAASHFEGDVLAQTNITMLTGASISGRLLSQTLAALNQNTVTLPPP